MAFAHYGTEGEGLRTDLEIANRLYERAAGAWSRSYGAGREARSDLFIDKERRWAEYLAANRAVCEHERTLREQDEYLASVEF